MAGMAGKAIKNELERPLVKAWVDPTVAGGCSFEKSFGWKQQCLLLQAGVVAVNKRNDTTDFSEFCASQVS